MLLGLTEPTAGEARVEGLDATRAPLEVKRRVGYLPDDVGFYGDLSGRENLRYTAALNRVPRVEAEERIDSLLRDVGLSDAGDRRVSEYSRGMGAGRVSGGADQEVAVTMRATGYVVPKGHTLRLAVTPAYWPMLWPLRSGPALTIDRERSRLDLPVVPPKAATSSVVAPEPEQRHDRGSPRRWSSQVFGSDEVRMERVTDSGVVTLDDASWWRVGDRTTWSTGDDPLQSTTTTAAAMERGRADWRVRWQATSTMTADAECFHVAVSVSASANDETVFERSYAYDIARDHC